MNDKKVIRGLGVISGAAMLAACGGGGSGSSENQEGATLQFDTENYAEKRIAITADSDVDSILGLYGNVAGGLSLIGEVQEILVPGGAQESTTVNCDGGGTLRVSYIENDNGADQTLTFSSCIVTTDSFGSVLLNGDYEAGITLANESAASVEETYNITGELQGTGDKLQIVGSADTEVTMGSNNDPNSLRLVNSIDVFEVKIGTNYAAITDAQTRINSTDSEVEFSISGKVLGSDIGGYIQLSTPTSVVISNSEVCPTSGVIRIASDGIAEVLYGSSAGGTASAVAVWIDGQVIESYSDCSSVGFTSSY